MMKKQVLIAAMMAAISAPVFAGTDVEAHVSTLGYGLGMGFQATDSVVARVGINQFSKTYTKTSGSINYNGDLKLSTADFLADWHPWGGMTHLTAGLIYNNNKAELTSVGSYSINGQQLYRYSKFHCDVQKGFALSGVRLERASQDQGAVIQLRHRRPVPGQATINGDNDKFDCDCSRSCDSAERPGRQPEEFQILPGDFLWYRLRLLISQALRVRKLGLAAKRAWLLVFGRE